MKNKSNGKKRLLLFADWFDPAYKAGGPIRSCVNFVSNLKDEYDLFICTSDRDLGSNDPLPGILINQWQQYNNAAKIYYTSPDQLNYKFISKIIRDIQPHFIYLNSLFSRYFSIYPLLVKRFQKIAAKIVLAPRGMLKPSALQFKFFKKRIFLQLFRLLGLHRFILFHATDETEVTAIGKFFYDSNVMLASNFPAPIVTGTEKIDKQPGHLSILFIGRIHPIKNLDFLLKALRSVKGAIQLTIVGIMEQEEYWRKCEIIIRKLPSAIRINYAGEIPHRQLAAIIGKHHIFALPTKGENFGHAIFDALSGGRPVLISDQTPWRNLKEQNAGWDLDLQDPIFFSQALQEAVNWDQDIYAHWSMKAQQLAITFYENAELKEKYKQIFS